MIGLIRVLPPPRNGTGTATLETLPEPPAPGYAGFVVACSNDMDAADVVGWCRRLWQARPDVPVGMVARGADCAAGLAALEHPLCFLLNPEELLDGSVPPAMLDRLRDGGVEDGIFQELVDEYGPALREEEVAVKALIATAVGGGTLAGAARDLDIHRDTLTRRLRTAGIAGSGLRARVRLRAYELRLELGVDRTTALRACGWFDQDARRKAALRVGRHGA